MKNGKLVWVVIIVLIIIGGIYSLNNSNQKKDSITLGFVGPLSGDAALWGNTERNVTEMAVQEINDNGGIRGQKVEVIYEDGKCNGKDATNAIQKLVSVDKVRVILGGTCSAETLAMAPIAEQNKVILLSAFSSNPEITNSGDYIFRNSPSDTDVAKLDAETIAKKYKKVAIVTENTDYSQGVRKVMKDVFEQKNVSVVSDEVYNSGLNDFRSIITKIKSQNPEVIYANPGTSGKGGGAMVKQLRELGFKSAIHGNFALATADALAVGGKALEGVVISDSSDLSEKGRQVKDKYLSQFKSEPGNDYEMGAAYDRVYIIKQAIEKAGLDTAKVKDYLYQMPDYSGTIGTYHFDSNGDVVGVGFTNLVMKDGKKLPYNQ